MLMQTNDSKTKIFNSYKENRTKKSDSLPLLLSSGLQSHAISADQQYIGLINCTNYAAKTLNLGNVTS